MSHHASTSIGGGDRPVGRSFATRSPVRARRGVAATSQPLATETALHVLRRGGTAVDAAVAANAALAVTEPTGAGLGGDLFALVWDAGTGRLHGLDGSGRSPRSLTLAHLDALGLASIPSFGPLPVTVPGCVDAWHALHARFGRLPVADLLAPAIALARDGFPVSDVIAFQWARGGALLREHPGFAETFLPEGRAPRAGETFVNPGLADTLEQIARGGRDAFYRGPIARAVDAFSRRVGAFLLREDLDAHESTWVDPVSTRYRGHDVWQIPPAGQGIAVLQMLNLLEPLDIGGMGFGTPDHVHHLVEAKKVAYEDRARYYADRAFSDVPVDALISKDYAERRRPLIDGRRAALRVPPGDARLAGGDTVALAVGDEARNMVVILQSNFRGFGSGLCPDGLGFCLQDRGELFALDPAHANAYAPGKRPFHTIIPGFVTRGGRPLLAFGVMGGDMQPQGHVQILSNLLDFGMGLQEAGDAPRVYHTGSSEPTGTSMKAGGTVSLESGFPSETVRELLLRGHRIRPAVGVFGGYQAVCLDETEDAWVAASESRKDGHAGGF